MTGLPEFRYHPDPLASGSIVVSHTQCACCGEARGYVYTGPTYGRGNYSNEICPWCIADGSAHHMLGIVFTDEDGIGDYGEWGDVSAQIVEEIAHRTAGFSGWQQERWWVHCSDGAAFVGPAGYRELVAAGPQAVEAIRQDAGEPPGPHWNAMLQQFDKDHGLTAYLFRCLHCGALGGYQDCH